jgi:hypothetical protein
LSRGKIHASGARGPEFKSRTCPAIFMASMETASRLLRSKNQG